MGKMLLGTPHFVRCIRPNDLRTPSEFHQEKVVEQLRYTGVLETTRIRKEVHHINNIKCILLLLIRDTLTEYCLKIFYRGC